MRETQVYARRICCVYSFGRTNSLLVCGLIECESWCLPNPKEWIDKCAWPTCSKCSACERKSSCMSQLVICYERTVERTSIFCTCTVISQHTSTIGAVTTTENPGALVHGLLCAQLSQTYDCRIDHSFSMSLVGCESWCDSNSHDWNLKCTWATCFDCSECGRKSPYVHGCLKSQTEVGSATLAATGCSC